MSRQDRGRGDTKGERRETRARRSIRNHSLPGDSLSYIAPRIMPTKQPLTPQTEAQRQYMSTIATYDLVFCKGPAGTGKTYIPATMAAAAIEAAQVNKIIITRPAVGAEEEYGFFPGDLNEKVAPWAKPVIAILQERLGAGRVEYMLKAETIEIAPLGMLRGHTFNDAFVIFDEAQNATPSQMKLFLTRIGQNVKVIVDGDPFDQKDIAGLSGFDDAWRVMEGHPSVGFIEFDIDDIVRSGLCRDVLIRYAQKKDRTVGHAELQTVLGARKH